MAKRRLSIISLTLLSVTLWLLTACALPLPAAAPIPPRAAEYGQRVRMGVRQMVNYPDFTLTYLGKRVERSDQYPRGFTFYDFQARDTDDLVKIAWSSGTGDIGPVFFEIGGASYRLERIFSDELGKLADDEVVIWQETPPAPTPTAMPQPRSTTPTLGEPFEISWMEAATLADANLSITFLAVTSETRCPISDGEIRMVCEVRGEAEVMFFVSHANGDTSSIHLSSDARGRLPNHEIVDGFQIQLVDVQPVPHVDRPEIDQADYVVTILVTEVEVVQLTPTTTPPIKYDTIVISCEGITPAIAQAVLGEPVMEESVLLNFFCVYGSQAVSEQPAPEDFPLYLGEFANRHVVAATQWRLNDEPDPLLGLAERVRAAYPEEDETPLFKLKTYLAAGLPADALGQLASLAHGAEMVQVEPVDGLADGAIWFWQTLPDGRHFAALLAVDSRKYGIVYALVNPMQRADNARTAMISLGRTLIRR